MPGFLLSMLAVLILTFNTWIVLIFAYVIPSVMNGFMFSCGLQNKLMKKFLCCFGIEKDCNNYLI